LEIILPVDSRLHKTRTTIATVVLMGGVDGTSIGQRLDALYAPFRGSVSI
jgi:hypothetical protein